MATEALKSTWITNRDATPAVLSNNGGQLHRVTGVIEGAGGDAGSTYRFCEIPSNARSIKVTLATDDLSGAGATLDVGIYQNTANGGAVVDADFFASAVDVATAAVATTDVTYERLATRFADAAKPLWEQLGLSADSQRTYDVVGTSGTAAVTGTMCVTVEYTV